MTLYEGAIYMVQAQPWQVERLDWVGRKAFVRRTEADYYTDAIDYTRLKVLEAFAERAGPSARCAHGEVHLVRRVAGYKKIRYYTHENVGYGNVNLPDQELHTTALWWGVSPEALDAAFSSRAQALDGFLGAAHAMHFVAAILTMSEPRDLGRAVGDSQSTWFATVGRNGRGETRTLAGDNPEPALAPAGGNRRGSEAWALGGDTQERAGGTAERAGDTPHLTPDKPQLAGDTPRLTHGSPDLTGDTPDLTRGTDALPGAGAALAGDAFRPTVFLYDNYPGGIGLSAPLFDQADEVVARARAVVEGCGCRSGCPACVGPILASDETRGFSPKAAALTVLNLLARA